jgi:SAM-dependent methyltransferase
LIEKLLRYLVQKKVQVVFNDLGRIKPVSSVFGLDRGTPIDRQYIDGFLQANSRNIKGKVLEVGDSSYSKKFAEGKVTSFEILHAVPGNKAATIVGDLADSTTLPEGCVDCFICAQTLQFIFDVKKAIEGAHHLLKPGGVLLATVPGISQVSRYDMDRWGDYWRFTTASIKKLVEPVFKGGVQVESFGNVLAATAFLQGIVVEDLPNPSLLDENDPDYQLVITIVAWKTS